MQIESSFTLPVPTIALCGWSGSGKTTLLEQLISTYSKQGFRVGIIKHDAHKLEIDHKGKNTYRLWQSGSQSLLAHDEQQVFIRLKKSDTSMISTQFMRTSSECDFVLIEGHKNTPLPKIWLEHPEKPGIPDDVDNIIAVLQWNENRLEQIQDSLFNHLQEQWKQTPLYAGILTGGKSTRMGFPKQDMQIRKQSVLNQITKAVTPYVEETILLGVQPSTTSKQLRCLPDIPGLEGPLSAIISAFRWNPHTAWIFLACDLPNIYRKSIEWLLDQRKFGIWAVVPKDEKYTHPLFAIYEPNCLSLLEDMMLSNNYALRSIVEHEKIMSIAIPKDLQSAWINCNTPEELHNLNQDSNTVL